MLNLEFVEEVAVVGVPDEEYDQRVAALVVLRDMVHYQRSWGGTYADRI